MGGDIHFPDVCKTPMPPPVGMLPIPYPNLAFNMMAVSFSLNVFWTFMPALNMISRIAMSMGDEPGVLGGLISGIIKGPAGVWMGNPIVAVNGMPAKNLLSPTHSNNYNAALGMSAIPSLTNVLLTDREAQQASVPAIADLAGAASCPPEIETSLDDAALRKLQTRLAESEPAHGVVLPAGVAVIRLALMTSDVSRIVFNLLNRLGGGSISALVLDLRGNPGGDARASLDLCDDFLPHGTLLAWHQQDDDKTPLYARQRSPYGFPLAIVIDRQTASAAELFAGVLQAHGRATLYGERSWGKGSIQQLASRAAGGAAYPTTGRYLLPDESAFDGDGLTPDVVATTEPGTRDEALDRAIDWASQHGSAGQMR